MNSTMPDKRPRLPSILNIYQPIEEYWESFAPAPVRDSGPEQVLDPFDGLLIHLALDMIPGFPVLVDLAAESTGGASSLIGLNHPHVGSVLAVAASTSTAAARALSALRGYVRTRGPGLAPLDVVRIEELSATLSDRSRVVILADARAGDPLELVDRTGRWLDELPDALVLLLGLGRVGESPVFGPLLQLCAEDSGKRFRLFRELGEVLAASNLGIVARDDHPFAAEVLLRISLLYDGNFHFLDLLKSVNQSAMQDAQVDLEVTKTHPFWDSMRVEIETLNRRVQETSAQLHIVNAERFQLWAMLQEMHETIVLTPLGTVVRRKLARGIVGKLYRASKQHARKVVSRIR